MDETDALSEGFLECHFGELEGLSGLVSFDCTMKMK